MRKKMKQKAFAANVNRDDITRGAEALGPGLDEHLGRVIAALQAIAPSWLGTQAPTVRHPGPVFLIAGSRAARHEDGGGEGIAEGWDG